MKRNINVYKFLFHNKNYLKNKMFPKFSYPRLRKEQKINKHGLPDPYEWIENDLQKEEITKWIDEENQITDKFLKVPLREKIQSRLKSLTNYEKYSSPMKYGGLYYFFHNTGLQNHSVLYVQETLSSQPKVVLDPNSLSEDGNVSINHYSFSDNGEYLAYGLSKSGSDWVTCYIKNLKTNEDFKEKLEWIKFSGYEWTSDNKGFFYVRYPKQEIDEESKGKEVTQTTSQMVYYHLLGTPQENDRLVYAPENDKLFLYPLVSNDGNYLVLTIYEGTDDECKKYIAKIDNISEIKFEKIVDNFDHKVEYITNDKETFYFKTNYNAKNRQIMRMQLSHPEKTSWKTVVPESKNPLESAICFNDTFLLLLYTIDATDVLHLHKLETGEFIKTIELPSLGSVSLSCQKHQEEFFFKFTSYLYPGLIYRYSLKNNTSELFKEIALQNFNRDSFKTEQIFYESKDGTKIPMFLISKKGMELNGNNAIYLYGYGGFAISTKPWFYSNYICLMENLNVCVVEANIRGGGEYGDIWHESAKKQNRQKSFDDFQAAAEYLIKNKYSNPNKIAIHGISNGGLLVATCVNQRPDLFGCAIVAQGVLDMLKYHLYTIGYAWITEYGNPDNKEDAEYIMKYSPVHNVKEKTQYPAMLIRTSDYDDRVVPTHSYKFVSELRDKVCEENIKPILLNVEKKAGHGYGKSTTKTIEENADNFTFIALSLNLEYKE